MNILYILIGISVFLLILLVILLLILSSARRSDSIRKGYQSRRDVRKIKEQIEEEE